MVKNILLLLVIVLLHLTCLAQVESEQQKFTDRLVLGGGLGLQFGTVTFIDISPVVGYKLTRNLETGFGITYKYYKYNDFYKNLTTGEKIDLKSHMLGASIYSKYYFLENFFAHAEFERLRYNYENIYEMGGQIIREDMYDYINSLFVGGGLMQRIGGRANLFVMALWNLTEEPNTPYNNPIIRMGVVIGR